MSAFLIEPSGADLGWCACQLCCSGGAKKIFTVSCVEVYFVTDVGLDKMCR
jgi:hypothetical protein